MRAPETERAQVYSNPLKEALRYQRLMDEGQAATRAEVSRIVGVTRARVTQMLNLLKLDSRIQEFILVLDDTDDLPGVLTERRLRPIAKAGSEAQLRRFEWLTVTLGFWRSELGLSILTVLGERAIQRRCVRRSPTRTLRDP